MSPNVRPLKVVMLAAGSSIRMGHPKHLLPFADGRPSYQNRLEMLQTAVPDALSICLFLKDPSEQAEIESPPRLDIQVLLESSLNTTNFQDQVTHLGSMAGLLVAFQTDPECDWLVLPCDYPLMTVEEIKRLRLNYKAPITCFENGQGLLEPYAAIWGPEALASLNDRVERGMVDNRAVPRDVISDMNGRRLHPLYYHSLFNTNTKEDWELAMSLLESERRKVVNGADR